MLQDIPHNIFVFTVCTAQQYPFAKVLAESLPSTVAFKVGVLEATLTESNTVALEDLSLPNLSQMRERYDTAAFMAAIVPFFGAYFLGQKGVEKVIYVDPTVQFFGDLEDIIAALQSADILLTPRITKKFGEAAYGDEKLFLNTGMYDAGFWAVRKTDNTLRFLHWWQARLADRAHFDLCNGMNHAQLWLNYVPIFFDKVMVNKNLGWNVGLQNLHERVLTRHNQKWVVNLSELLVFVNFREMMDESRAVKTLIGQSAAEALVKEYRNQLKKYSNTYPNLFSLYQAINPKTSVWRNALRQKIQALIAAINHFPTYHKSIK